MSLGPSSRFCIWLALCLACPASWLDAQNPSASQPFANPGSFAPELLQQLEAIKSAALQDDYAYRQLAHLTENIGPRPTGSAAADAAVEYVAAQMRDLGLEVHLEKCRVHHWARGAETAELVDYTGRAAGAKQKIVLTALGGSTSTGANGITADIIVVDDFDHLKNLGRDRVVGKIVLFNRRFDEEKANAGLGFKSYRETIDYREKGAQAAAQLGAVAALVQIGRASCRERV